MSDAEGKILKIYDKSKPEDEDLHETQHYNPLGVGSGCGPGRPGLLALHRPRECREPALCPDHQQVPDPVFKGEVDRQCLRTVRSREHWWEHLWYGVSHVKPEVPDAPRR
jgi:hypothetical protein